MGRFPAVLRVWTPKLLALAPLPKSKLALVLATVNFWAGSAPENAFIVMTAQCESTVHFLFGFLIEDEMQFSLHEPCLTGIMAYSQHLACCVAMNCIVLVLK